MAQRPEEITIRSIGTLPGRLPLNEGNVLALMQSIKEVGLLQPIVVARKRHGVFLVAGYHRLEAAKRLKHKVVTALVENEDSPAVERWQLLAEIDENLIRRELTAAQRASLIGRRKAAYEAVHPETKHGGAKGNVGEGRGKAPAIKGAKSAPLIGGSFVEDTATKTGRSTRAVEADATRAKRLGDDLGKVVGTSLDKGAELDALSAMPAEERAPIIERAVAGERVSTVRDDPLVEANLKRAWEAFRSVWHRAPPGARAEFVSINREALQEMFDHEP